MCIQALIYPNHCPTSCWTNNYTIALFPGLHAQLLSQQYCKRQKLGVEAWEQLRLVIGPAGSRAVIRVYQGAGLNAQVLVTGW